MIATAVIGACSDPADIGDMATDTIVIDGVTATARVVASTGVAELTLNNQSASQRTLQFGGCSLRLFVFESGSETLRYDSMTGGCDDDLQTVTLAPGQTATVNRTVARPGQLTQYAGVEGIVRVSLNNENRGELRAPILGP